MESQQEIHQRLITVYVITVTILSKKRYLKEYNTRSHDKKHIAYSVTEESSAIKFATKQLANDILKDILDPYNFGYKVEPLAIPG